MDLIHLKHAIQLTKAIKFELEAMLSQDLKSKLL